MTEKELQDNIKKLDQVLYKAIIKISAMEATLVNNAKELKRLDKTITEQNKQIAKLLAIISDMKKANDRSNRNVDTDINDIRSTMTRMVKKR